VLGEKYIEDSKGYTCLPVSIITVLLQWPINDGQKSMMTFTYYAILCI